MSVQTYLKPYDVVLISDVADFRDGPDFRLRWFQKPRKRDGWRERNEQQKTFIEEARDTQVGPIPALFCQQVVHDPGLQLQSLQCVVSCSDTFLLGLFPRFPSKGEWTVAIVPVDDGRVIIHGPRIPRDLQALFWTVAIHLRLLLHLHVKDTV